MTVRIAVSRRFESGDHVRSALFGVGEVAVGGAHPTVRFLTGLQRTISAETIAPIPDEVYEYRVLNETMIELWLDWRLYGRFVRDIWRPLPCRRRTAESILGGASE